MFHKVVLGTIGVASAGTLLAVSGTINYVGTHSQLSNAKGIGLDLTSLISAGSVAFDGLSILVGVVVFRLICLPGLGLWRRLGMLALTCLAGALFMGYSSWAAVGYFAQHRGDTVAGREKIETERTNVTAQIAEDRERRGWLAQQMPVDVEAGQMKPLRPVGTIQAEIDKLLRNPATEGCPPGVPANGPVTREVCPQVDQLRAEKELAQKAAELDRRIEANLEKLDDLKAVGESDAQASFFSWLFGAGMTDTQRAFILLIVAAFELGKPLSGALIAMALMDPPVRREPPDDAGEDDEEDFEEAGNVVRLPIKETDETDQLAETVKAVMRERGMPDRIRTEKLRAAVAQRAGDSSDQALNTAVGRTMQQLGYERRRAYVAGNRFYVYEREGEGGAQAVAA